MMTEVFQFAAEGGGSWPHCGGGTAAHSAERKEKKRFFSLWGPEIKHIVVIIQAVVFTTVARPCLVLRSAVESHPETRKVTLLPLVHVREFENRR